MLFTWGGPAKGDVVDDLVLAVSKMEDFGRLAQEAIAGAERAPQGTAFSGDRFQVQFDAQADGIATGALADAGEGDPPWGWGQTIAKKLEARPGAIGIPEVEIAIAIPVGGNDAARVIDLIEPKRCRDIGEEGLSCWGAQIEQGDIFLPAAEAAAAREQGSERIPSALIVA